MTVAELIRILQCKNQESEVMVMDGSNGGGSPRSLNFGPTDRFITEENHQATADCENRVGEHVVVIGYGSY
jgi:hypothetical protein